MRKFDHQVPQDTNYYAGEQLPSEPPCYGSMQARLLEYDACKVTVAIPVLENYLNPAGSMQGGFITAAFDNVFGPLCLFATGTPNTTTLDIYTTYHRPIFLGDSLIITATIKAQGGTAIHMTAEAFNQEGKLIASAISNYIIRQNPR